MPSLTFAEYFGAIFPAAGEMIVGAQAGVTGSLVDGTYVETAVGDVRDGTLFGPSSTLEGTLVTGGGAPADPPLCAVTIPIINQYGGRLPDVSVSFKFAGLQAAASTGGVIMSPPPAVVSDSDGLVTVNLIRLVNYTATCRLEGETRNIPIEVPDAGSYTVADA